MNLAARIRFATLFLAAAFAGAAPAAAQTVIGGGGGNSSVIVDYSVLDAMGPAPNVPQLLMPPGARAFPPPAAGAPMPRFPVVKDRNANANSGGIVLKPPSETTSRRRTTRAKPRPVKKPKAVAPPSVATRTPEPPPPPPPPAPEPARMEAKAPPKAPEPPPTPAAAAPEPPAPPPMEASKPAAEPAPKSKVAAVSPPSNTSIAPGQSVRIGFDSGSAKLGDDATQRLKRVAAGMNVDDQLRIQLLAYAGGTSDTASQARRLSLSRALAARSFLLGENVRSTRIDVRALGNKSEGGPPDRIDIIITKR